MSKYDYLIVGAGLFGAVAVYRAARSGKKALVIDRRPHTGGNAYCEEREGIRVHKYGAHIFHTSNREVWEFVNRFVEFNNYINSPVANYKGKLYNLPFNMNTFYAMWGVTTPAQAAEMIDRQRREAGMLTHDFPQFYLDCEETGEPELIWVASKSGSMNACRNDGGIVHTPYGEYVIVLMNKDFHDIIEYNDHPSMVYGARVSRMILDQILACEGELYK